MPPAAVEVKTAPSLTPPRGHSRAAAIETISAARLPRLDRLALAPEPSVGYRGPEDGARTSTWFRDVLDWVQRKMRAERETPQAMPYGCYGLLPCDRTRSSTPGRVTSGVRKEAYNAQ